MLFHRRSLFSGAAWAWLSSTFGAKAAGEVPIDGPAPAIVNAICDAVGVRMYRIPATSERVWRQIKEAGE